MYRHLHLQTYLTVFYLQRVWVLGKIGCEIEGVHVLCMGVNEIVSTSKQWHGLLDNFRIISVCLTPDLTHLVD